LCNSLSNIFGAESLLGKATAAMILMAIVVWKRKGRPLRYCIARIHGGMKEIWRGTPQY
jgi:hypothetical protein